MRKERYVFRADGNAMIGAGHLMRCIAIAEALAELLQGKEEILFLCADEQSAALAEKKGFCAEVFHTDYTDMESELPLWRELFLRGSGEGKNSIEKSSIEKGRCIVVDSYHVTDAFLKQLRSCGAVFLLDDMQRQAFPVAGVINYNAFADKKAYESLYAGTDTSLYIGSSYIPIRKEFSTGEYRVRENVKKVLITTGGSDRDNIAGKILDCIYEEEKEFHLVVGSLSPHLLTLKKLAAEKRNVFIHHNVQDMASLMHQCDLAVTAGGSTIYELAAVGVPFLCFSYADNQEALVKYAGREQIGGEAGAFHRDEKGTLQRMKALFASFCGNSQLRKDCSEKAHRLADGKGARRLAEILMQAGIKWVSE